MPKHVIHGIASIRRNDYPALGCIRDFVAYHRAIFPDSRLVLWLMGDSQTAGELETYLSAWIVRYGKGTEVTFMPQVEYFDTFRYRQMRREFADRCTPDQWVSFLDVDERLPVVDVKQLMAAADHNKWDAYAGVLFDSYNYHFLDEERTVTPLPLWQNLAPDDNDYGIPKWDPVMQDHSHTRNETGFLFSGGDYLTAKLGATSQKIPFCRAYTKLSVGQHRVEDGSVTFFFPALRVNHYKWHIGLVPQTRNRIAAAKADPRITWINECQLLNDMFRNVDGQWGIALKSKYLKLNANQY